MRDSSEQSRRQFLSHGGKVMMAGALSEIDFLSSAIN